MYYYLWTRGQLEEYGIKLGQKECEDRQGRKFTWLGTEDGTYGIFKEIAEKQMGNDRYLQTVVDIKQLELRDNDVMICTFPRAGMHFIRRTCPCDLYPLTSHFYIVKLGFTGVNIIFLFLLQNIDCGYSLEPPH